MRRTIYLAAFLLAWTPTAGARDDGRYANSPLKGWFDGLVSDKGPCCSDADGTALSDPEWEQIGEDLYRVKVDGQWWDVPKSALVHTSENRAGVAMVWPVRYGGPGGEIKVEIRCFMAGPQG